jgi:hypothetical protein
MLRRRHTSAFFIFEPLSYLTYHRPVVAKIATNKQFYKALQNVAPRSVKAGKCSALRVVISYPALPNMLTLQEHFKNDESNHPGAIVNIKKLASHGRVADIMSSLAPLVTKNAQQQQAAEPTGSPSFAKRKVGLELPDPKTTSPKRRK